MPRKLIMCGDHPVLAFEYEPASGRACSSGEVLDPRRLPLEFTTHGKSALYARRIDEWWKSRAIPSTRDGIRRVLDSLGASSTGELLDRTYGLSLSDQYWVKREDDPVEWKDVNFFDNPFDEALGEILLTSYSSSHDISLNAPDVSTGGDLPKRWTINKNTGRRLLVKSGRTGQEPMNEVIASKLCARLGVPAVPYSLARSGNRLVCTCEDMLTSHEELVSAWQVLQSIKTTNGLNSHDQWIHAAAGCGADERAVRDATDDWLVVDYLMRNTDRHYNNFGLIRDIETLEVRPAPIYDTGASLWSGELDVDGRDWFAKPFYTATGKPSALRQLRLVEDWSRFDLDALSDWPDEVAHELSRACACSLPNASTPSGTSSRSTSERFARLGRARPFARPVRSATGRICWTDSATRCGRILPGKTGMSRVPGLITKVLGTIWVIRLKALGHEMRIREKESGVMFGTETISEFEMRRRAESFSVPLAQPC